MAAWNYAWGDDIFGGTGWLVRTVKKKRDFFEIYLEQQPGKF